MENRESQMSQLKVLISSGSPDNAGLAYQIACGLDLQEELMKPWRDLWAVYSEQEADDVSILTELCQLKKIDLVEKDLEEFPQALLMMPHLEIINLSGNYIVELPEALFSLNHLLRLDLNGNLLESVPEKLFQMKNLLCLELSDNFLEELPDSFGKIKAINIAGNNLATAPNALPGKHNRDNDMHGFLLDFSGMDSDRIDELEDLLPELVFDKYSMYYCLCGGGCDQEYFPYEKIYVFSDELNESSHKIRGSFHRRYYRTGINLSELYEDAYEKFECNW